MLRRVKLSAKGQTACKCNSQDLNSSNSLLFLLPPAGSLESTRLPPSRGRLWRPRRFGSLGQADFYELLLWAETCDGPW
jgi:hypothetical protein